MLTAAAMVLGLPPVGSPVIAAAAEPTRVDTSFGGGFASHSFSDIDDEAADVALQPDGAAVVVGRTRTEPFDRTPADLLVTRFTATGRLDRDFGTDGAFVFGLPDQYDYAEAVAIQEDGKIVVGAGIDSEPAVLRLTADGALDPDFGRGGVVVVRPGQYRTIHDVVLQPDGKILFTGGAVAVGRLLSDGTPDASFGTAGLTPLPPDPDPNAGIGFVAMALQSDGRIVVAGSWNGPTFGGPAEHAAIARYTSAGALDPSFGHAGIARTNLDAPYADRGVKISDVVLQPDGRIVGAGTVYEWDAMGTPTPGGSPTYGPVRRVALSDVALFRYLPDGGPDTSFAGKGVVISRITSRTVTAQRDWQPGVIGVPDTDTRGAAVALARDGTILVAGDTYESQRVPLVLRYTSSGLLDPTFGHDGALVVDLGGKWGLPSAVALDPDGRLLVVGSSRTGFVEPGRYWDVMVGRVLVGPGAGTVWTWGWNAHGQLGDGTTTDQHAPKQVAGLTGVVSVSAGPYHTLALRGDGTVWAWGMNAVGQLGDGTLTPRRRPVKVPGLTGVVAVSAGGLHSLALRGDGTVWAWGWGGFGQLGDGSATTRSVPTRVPALEGIAAISAGLYHSLAIREDGMALAWGFNAVGQLGDGTTVDRRSPVWLTLMPANYAYHQLSAGSLHSLAVGVNASFGATGWNGYRQVNGAGGDMHGFGAPLPQVAHAASAGWYHSLLLHTNGTVLSSGWNVVGQLGDGSTDTRGWGPVPALTGVRAISAGGLHNLALKDDGSLVAWGWNVVGQLGTGTVTDARRPVTVDASGSVAAVSAGYLHSVAIRR